MVVTDSDDNLDTNKITPATSASSSIHVGPNADLSVSSVVSLPPPTADEQVSKPDVPKSSDISSVSITTLGDDGHERLPTAIDPTETQVGTSDMETSNTYPLAVNVDALSTSKTQIIPDDDKLPTPEEKEVSECVPSTTVVSIADEIPIVLPSDSSANIVNSNITSVALSNDFPIKDNITVTTSSKIEQEALVNSEELHQVSSKGTGDETPVRKKAELRQRSPDSTDFGADISIIPPPPPLSQEDIKGAGDQHPAQIIASIGSEGTVIVRTPTPTSSSSPTPSQQQELNQSVVTFSGMNDIAKLVTKRWLFMFLDAVLDGNSWN